MRAEPATVTIHTTVPFLTTHRQIQQKYDDKNAYNTTITIPKTRPPLPFHLSPLGHRVMYDDYREAYFWLRQNTHPDAKILSW